MKSFCLLVLLFGSYIVSTNVYGFDCPAVSASDDCELDPLCSVCNEQNNGMYGPSVMCSQCIDLYFLYAINQCLQCQDTFGNECLHCSTQGCQQCADGYQRVLDADCGVYYCELLPEPEACDDNCRSCQNLNNPANAYCSQCNQNYFLSDNTGLNGCLSCEEEYGDSCMFCANLQGCQQCKTGFNRKRNDETGLHYCECAYDCYQIITFEELVNFTTFDFIGNIPNGYFDLTWNQNDAVDPFPPSNPNFIWNHFIYSFFGVPGAISFNNSDTEPDYGLVSLLGFYDGAVQSSTIHVGESGGIQFKLVQFGAKTIGAEANTIACDGYLNGNLQFNLDPAGILTDELTVDTITINNNIIIDEFKCYTFGTDFIIVDNIHLIFV